MDAVAELVKRESAIKKTAVYGLNSGAVSPMFSCIETDIVTFVPNREPYSSYLHQPLSIPPAAIIWARGKV